MTHISHLTSHKTNLLILDCVEMNLTNSVHGLLVLKRHEAEAAMPLGLLVHQHDGLLDFPWNRNHISVQVTDPAHHRHSELLSMTESRHV